MEDDQVNMSIRRFLKRLGIGTQREIEAALRRAETTGGLPPEGRLDVSAVVSIPSIGLEHRIEDVIELTIQDGSSEP